MRRPLKSLLVLVIAGGGVGIGLGVSAATSGAAPAPSPLLRSGASYAKGYNNPTDPASSYHPCPNTPNHPGTTSG